MRTLKSTAGDKTTYSEAALHDMRESLVAAQAHLGEMKREKDAALHSLIEVAKMRNSPSRHLPHQPGVEGSEQDTGQQQQQDEADERGNSVVGSSGGGRTHGCDRNGDARWSLHPDFIAVHRTSDKWRSDDFTQVLDDEGSEGPMKEADLGDISSSRVRAPEEPPPRTPGGTAAELTAGRRRADDGGAWRNVGWNSSSGTGEHVCRVRGAPAPSFRKLFECRLNLDRTRVELSEARARGVLNEEGEATDIPKVSYTVLELRYLDYVPEFVTLEAIHHTRGPTCDRRNYAHSNGQHYLDKLSVPTYLAETGYP